MTRGCILGLLLALACACDAAPALCFTADGRGLGAGEVDPRDACKVCDPRSAELRPRWAAECVREITVPNPEHHMYYWLVPGPDADGDGLGDVIVLDGSDPSVVDSLRVLSTADGRLLGQVVHEDLRHRGGSAEYQYMLGPDADGDGLADVLLWSDRAYADQSARDAPVNDAPDPGQVRLYSPARDAIIHTWTGASDCRALGFWADLGPDVNGDGLADPLIADLGCVQFVEPASDWIASGSRAVEPNGAVDGWVRIYSGASDEVLVEWRAAPGQRSFGWEGAAFVPDRSGDGVEEVMVYTFDVPDLTRPAYGQVREHDLIQVFDPVSGAELDRWNFRDALAERGFFRTRVDLMSRDLTGDGQLDMLADLLFNLSGEHREPVVLLPGRVLPPTRRLRVFSEDGWASRGLRLLPDMDGDGADDVLSFAEDGSALRILDQDARELWSVPWRTEFARDEVARQRDLDGDGLVDIASLDTNGFSSGSIIRVFLSGPTRSEP